jgi:hypothetical protein
VVVLVGALLIALSAWVTPEKISLRSLSDLGDLEKATGKRRTSKWLFIAGVVAITSAITYVLERDY